MKESLTRSDQSAFIAELIIDLLDRRDEVHVVAVFLDIVEQVLSLFVARLATLEGEVFLVIILLRGLVGDVDRTTVSTGYSQVVNGSLLLLAQSLDSAQVAFI